MSFGCRPTGTGRSVGARLWGLRFGSGGFGCFCFADCFAFLVAFVFGFGAAGGGGGGGGGVPACTHASAYPTRI